MTRVSGSTVEVEEGVHRDPRHDPALRARLRKILVLLVVWCLVLGVAGFAFVRWMASLPPGTLKAP